MQSPISHFVSARATDPTNWAYPFQRPLLPPIASWSDDLRLAYDRRWFSNGGELSRRFEHVLTERVGRPVVACSNGTAAITAALLALDLPAAAEVVLPSFTFPATLWAVLQAGLTPVLADVDASTWELSPASVERVAEYCPRLGAVLAVRTFGLCRDMAGLQDWCTARGLPLVIDAAAALGGSLPDGTPAGCQGAMETFSLHATKPFAVGEGGAIACAPEYEPALRRILNFGLEEGRLLNAGFNGKMSEFVAAVGLAQSRVIEAHLALRRSAAQRYMDFFAQHAPDWVLPEQPGSPPWQSYAALAPSRKAADELESAAARLGVQLRRYYRPALHMAAVAMNFARCSLPVAEDLAGRMVCLPLYSDMGEAEQAGLLDRLVSALGRGTR
jgi:dTDP-4-amino-4,6-dideoxygalactose transaminase